MIRTATFTAYGKCIFHGEIDIPNDVLIRNWVTHLTEPSRIYVCVQCQTIFQHLHIKGTRATTVTTTCEKCRPAPVGTINRLAGRWLSFSRAFTIPDWYPREVLIDELLHQQGVPND